MQWERQERGIHAAETSGHPQRAFVPTLFIHPHLWVSFSRTGEMSVQPQAGPRFCGMNAALLLHRSGRGGKHPAPNFQL